MKSYRPGRVIGSISVLAAVLTVTHLGQAVPVALSKLTGTSGQTTVYKGDFSSIALGLVQSVTVADNSGASGSPGQFSGFHLDAVKLSTTDCSDAACAAGAPALAVFNFVGGTTFTPGTQRPPTDAKLFGTGPAGNTVDNAVATLGSFDGRLDAPTSGFISLGNNGSLSFALAPGTNTDGTFLYVGGVSGGGPGGGSAGPTNGTTKLNAPTNEGPDDVPPILLVDSRVDPAAVPEPAVLTVLLGGLAGLGRQVLKRRRA
jgi:hypothetical protein